MSLNPGGPPEDPDFTLLALFILVCNLVSLFITVWFNR
jgi:hypothetical protein